MPYNKSYTFGQDGWVLASFSFCVFMDLDFVSVHKNAKRELGQYPAIFALRTWSIIYMYGFKFKLGSKMSPKHLTWLSDLTDISEVLRFNLPSLWENGITQKWFFIVQRCWSIFHPSLVLITLFYSLMKFSLSCSKN